MTEPTITQADRNSAIRLLEAGGQDWQAKEIRVGEGDHFPIVQAFASHREAAVAELRAENEVLSGLARKAADAALSALDQPAQEPVYHIYKAPDGHIEYGAKPLTSDDKRNGWTETPLYRARPEPDRSQTGAGDVTTADVVCDIIRAEASDRAAFCAAHGISPQYLCDILKGRRDISDRVAAAVGYERVVVYRRIGATLPDESR